MTTKRLPGHALCTNQDFSLEHGLTVSPLIYPVTLSPIFAPGLLFYSIPYLLFMKSCQYLVLTQKPLSEAAFLVPQLNY